MFKSLIDAYTKADGCHRGRFRTQLRNGGNHAASLLADAWVKGIRTFDPEKALAAMYHEATNKGPHGPSNGRDGWREYFQLGYVPYPEYGESIAKTLEFCYDDFCAMQLAKLTGNRYYETIFGRQIFNYKQVYDTGTRFMRGRKKMEVGGQL